MAEVCTVFKFYQRIIGSAITEFHSVKAKVFLAGTIALSIIALFNQELADKFSHTWSGVSRWWSAVPIGILVGYRILRANYDAFAAIEQHFAKEHEEEKLQAVLGELLGDGANLRVERISDEVALDAWLARFNIWREKYP